MNSTRPTLALACGRAPKESLRHVSFVQVPNFKRDAFFIGDRVLAQVEMFQDSWRVCQAGGEFSRNVGRVLQNTREDDDNLSWHYHNL